MSVGEREDALDELLTDGEAAPPAANGEVVFDAPWQGRVFAMARLMAEEGYYSWDEFRAHLITEIGQWDRSEPASDPQATFRYYDHFLAAFLTLLEEKGLLDASGLAERFERFAARPHGHDH